MKYFKTFESFGDYQPSPFDSPKITSFVQGTPNGLAGASGVDGIIDPKVDVDEEFDRISRDLEPDNKIGKKRKKFNKKVKHFKTK